MIGATLTLSVACRQWRSAYRIPHRIAWRRHIAARRAWVRRVRSPSVDADILSTARFGTFPRKAPVQKFKLLRAFPRHLISYSKMSRSEHARRSGVTTSKSGWCSFTRN